MLDPCTHVAFLGAIIEFLPPAMILFGLYFEEVLDLQ